MGQSHGVDGVLGPVLVKEVNRKTSTKTRKPGDGAYDCEDICLGYGWGPIQDMRDIDNNDS